MFSEEENPFNLAVGPHNDVHAHMLITAKTKNGATQTAIWSFKDAGLEHDTFSNTRENA